MTLQTPARDHATRHVAQDSAHPSADPRPNLATLDQLRSGGRNALLSPRHRRRTKPAGCTTC